MNSDSSINNGGRKSTATQKSDSETPILFGILLAVSEGISVYSNDPTHFKSKLQLTFIGTFDLLLTICQQMNQSGIVDKVHMMDYIMTIIEVSW
jgi:hypothetical protein